MRREKLLKTIELDRLKETKRFHTAYHLYGDNEKFKLTDIMELHFIEMPKLIHDWQTGKLAPRDDVLAR